MRERWPNARRLSSANQRALRRSAGERLVMMSALQAPAAYGAPLDRAEHEVFDQQADRDDGDQAGEHRRNVERVAVLEDEPPETALAGRHAEHELRGDQRAPGERPADLHRSEDRRERRRN